MKIKLFFLIEYESFVDLRETLKSYQEKKNLLFNKTCEKQLKFLSVHWIYR